MFPRFMGTKKGYFWTFTSAYVLTYLFMYVYAITNMAQQGSLLGLYDVIQVVFGKSGFVFPALFIYATIAAFALQLVYYGFSYLHLTKRIRQYEAQTIGLIIMMIIVLVLFQYTYLALRVTGL